MGRKPVIKPAILNALSESKDPLKFSGLKVKTIQILNRNKLDDTQLNVNLNQLINDGVVEKILFQGKTAYKLTISYYEQQLKSTMISLLSEMKISQLHDSLDDDELPPHMIFLNPPAYNYREKIPIEQIDRYEIDLSFGGGPMESVGESRIIPAWEDPSRAISSIMLNDFYGLLEEKEKINTINLFRWAYWAGVRKEIEDKTYFDLQEAIERNKKFALKCIEEFRTDHNRVEVEETLIRILNITEELISHDNLYDFLVYLINKKEEHKHLLNKIMIREGLMAGGERLFLNFMEFGKMIINGFFSAGILKDDYIHHFDHKERQLLSSSKVWDDFFGEILGGSVFEPQYLKPELKEIKGNLIESLLKVRESKNYINNILELPFRRKIAIIYLWGFPETFYLSNRGILREFEEWREALIEGRLDHRSWIFEEGALTQLRKAYRAVKRNTEPLPIKIDLEPWSLQDLYKFHPFGRDPAFWDRLIRDIEARFQKRK
jgi:hypothetical protein